MSRQIYVNLPVKEIERAKAFFTTLGFSVVPEYTGEQSAGLRIAENIFVMLLVESAFQTFTKKELCDATKSTEVLLCLSCDSRQQVQDLVAKAVAAGGAIARDPEEHGSMYVQAIEDPDGHIWELAYMPSAQS